VQLGLSALRLFALTAQILHANADCGEIVGSARSVHVFSPLRLVAFYDVELSSLLLRLISPEHA
jgi:hypothetical protein